MELDIKSSPTRNTHSFSLKPEAVDLIKQLSDHYNHSASRVLETIIMQYAPVVLRTIENKKEAKSE